MGAACTGAKGKTTSAATTGTAGGTSEQPGATSTGADAHTTKASGLGAAGSVRDGTAHPAGSARSGVASAGEDTSHPEGGAVADLDSFRFGEGCGVYLVEEKAQNGTLVTQYARECPSDQIGLVLLQVKPPPYKPIPESRYTLQGGKRILRQNITASTKNAAGKARYCGLILDFVGLADTYKGFLWASPRLDEALQPFSVFVMETKHHLSSISALQRGGSAALQANGGSQQQHGGDGEGAETGTAAEKTEGQTQEQPNAGGVDKAGPEEPASSDRGTANDTLYVHYIEGGSAISYRLLNRCGVLPVPLEKANEIVPAGTKVESVDDLRKRVVGAGGAFRCETPTSGS